MTEDPKLIDKIVLTGQRSRRKSVAVVVVGLAVLLGGVWGAFRWQIRRLKEASRQASQDGDWKKLEASARDWTQWQPDEPEAWVFLADAVQRQNRFREAAAHLAHVPPDAPGYLNALIARSQLFFGPCNLPLQGESECLKVLELEPDTPAVYELLISYYAITMQRSQLRETIRRAIDTQCESRGAYAYLFMSETLRLGPAYRIISLWLNESPESELLNVAHALQMEDRLVQTGDAAADRKAASEKSQRVRQLLVQYPGNLNLISYDIDERIVDGDVDAVIDLLEAAGESGLKDNRIWRHRAWVHLTENEIDAAESACRRALELHPQDFLAMQLLSEVARIHRDFDEADRLQKLVLRANELRDRIREYGLMKSLPPDVLEALATWVRDAGDEQIAEALSRRLSRAEGPASGKAP